MPDYPDHSILQGLAAQIVSAYVANNSVPADALPALITIVARALAATGTVPAVADKRAPAVPTKKSVFPDHIVCLECGGHFLMMRRHLKTDHQMTPDQYRLKWELPASYPVVAPEYAARRSALAKKIGLGRRVVTTEEAAPKANPSPTKAAATKRRTKKAAV